MISRGVFIFRVRRSAFHPSSRPAHRACYADGKPKSETRTTGLAGGSRRERRAGPNLPPPPQQTAKTPHKEMPAAAAVHHPPGSHSASLRVSRDGFKISSPSGGGGGGGPGLKAYHPPSGVPPETHLWNAPAKRKRGDGVGDGSSGAAALAGASENGPAVQHSLPTLFPAQSPLRRVEWWRRPPSPLVSHMRPLWKSSSGGSGFDSELTSSGSMPAGPAAAAPEAPAPAPAPAASKRARARVSPPSEGEAAAGGGAHFKMMDTARVCER